MIRRIRVILFIALPMAAGCAGFRSNTVETPNPWPPAPRKADKKPSINVTFQGITGELLETFKKPTLKAYEKSGLFSQVSASARANSDLTAEVVVSDNQSGSTVLAFLCGLTLTLIPSTATDGFEVATTFRDASSNAVFSSKKNEDVTIWIEFFLVFVWPFMNPDTVTEQAIFDLAASSLADYAKS